MSSMRDCDVELIGKNNSSDEENENLRYDSPKKKNIKIVKSKLIMILQYLNLIIR